MVGKMWPHIQFRSVMNNMEYNKSMYSDWLRAGRSGDGIPAGAKFSAPVQTGPGAQPASCAMGTGFFPGGKERPGRDTDPSPHSSAVVMKE